jgi:hypothetical protein
VADIIMHDRLRHLAMLARFKQALEPALNSIAPGWEVKEMEVLANTRAQETEVRLVIVPGEAASTVTIAQGRNAGTYNLVEPHEGAKGKS